MPSRDLDESSLDDRPSKSQLKRESHALQALGEELAQLPDDRLKALEAPETLIEAIREYKRTRSHEGRRRQMQLIGKLMRQTDPEPLREAVASMKVPHARETLALHQAEHWREQLIAGDKALQQWMDEHPQTDTQQLRSLIRAARKEGELPPEKRHGRSYRELFQFIKKTMAGG
jgi:ribosome-associated protein